MQVGVGDQLASHLRSRALVMAGRVKVRLVRLRLEKPVAATGDRADVWIADEALKTVTRFDAASAEQGPVISVESPPVDVELTRELVWVGHADGSIVAYARSTGEEAFRHASSSGQIQLRSDGQRLWVLDRSVSALAVFDAAGDRRIVGGRGVITYAPGAGGVYWISEDGMVHLENGERDAPPPLRLPGGTDTGGALAVCANSLWLSVHNGLLMLSLRSLEPGPTIPAPEGPVPHLICDADSRIIGGARSVFVLDPAADDAVRVLDVELKSELLALVAAGDHVWALESAESIAHVIHIR